MARAKGTYYEDQISYAMEKYKHKNPSEILIDDDFKKFLELTEGKIEGYDKISGRGE